MGTLSALFDSTILIDYLNGSQKAQAELHRYQKRFISVIAWVEVMVKVDPQAEVDTRSFLNRFTVLPLSTQIAERSVILRRDRLKLPDAMIYATAQVHDLLFVTRNTRDFSEAMPGVRIPYEL